MTNYPTNTQQNLSVVQPFKKLPPGVQIPPPPPPPNPYSVPQKVTLLSILLDLLKSNPTFASAFYMTLLIGCLILVDEIINFIASTLL